MPLSGSAVDTRRDFLPYVGSLELEALEGKLSSVLTSVLLMLVLLVFCKIHLQFLYEHTCQTSPILIYEQLYNNVVFDLP